LKLIHFTADVDNVLGNPLPIKKLIPEWYKKAETYYELEEHSHEDENVEAKEQHEGLKTCAPFLDAMISGYAIVTPFDIFVGKKEDGSLNIGWTGPHDWDAFISERPKESGATMPRPAGHYPNHLVWSNKWGFKAPRGYSIMITHPFNRFDLPFTTMSGFIDSDNFFANGNLPFFIKEDFVGVIPEGTPIAQIIPVKRKKWKMIINPSYRSTYMEQGRDVRIKELNYKKKMWKRKEYN
jgi:hypothetical protein